VEQIWHSFEGANPSYYWTDAAGQYVDIKSKLDGKVVYSGFGG
jgi:hypothetical protein